MWVDFIYSYKLLYRYTLHCIVIQDYAVVINISFLYIEYTYIYTLRLVWENVLLFFIESLKWI